MRPIRSAFACIAFLVSLHASGAEVPAFPEDPRQGEERTCFQTSQPYSGRANLRSDVAIVYGIDAGLPARMASWRDRGYRVHLMTGVSWGHYQDYLYGRFDGINHEEEAQTEKSGKKISHGGDVYYMCPGTNYGRFLATGVQRALDAGAEAIHLEEPEFWVRAGWSEGFKREWQAHYGEPWQAPDSSPDAQWRASKLKYFLYRRALQQVFDHVQAFNQRTGRRVRCYVPTHSLLNYAHWHIVSPESSLAQLKGCDGYIAQVWTGTSRTPNQYQGVLRERTFETAFLEYGAMQNLVRGTGRRVWYLNDPIEDNPAHDWTDYRTNWESTLTASLLQPEVWRFEVAPWPERIFNGTYPAKKPDAKPISQEYATELQVVMHALNHMNQQRVEWDSGTAGLGVVVSDSLMFQRAGAGSSDPHLGHVYGLALPLVKHGMPVTPVQLENLGLPGYLQGFRVLALSYHGMKPLSADVHPPLARWVKDGGVLVVCDDDSDPYRNVREWWNSAGLKFGSPREHLFEALGIASMPRPQAGESASQQVGRGRVYWMAEKPSRLAAEKTGADRWRHVMREACDSARAAWKETAHLILRRGPYVVAAGLDESVPGPRRTISGRWINLFDPSLRVQRDVVVNEGSRLLLYDLGSLRGGKPALVAAACGALESEVSTRRCAWTVEGVARTEGVLLVHTARAPKGLSLDGKPLAGAEYSSAEQLLWIRFENEARPRLLEVTF